MPIEVAVYNVGANVRFGILETTERVYRKVWEMGALGGFLMGREVAKAMLARAATARSPSRRHRRLRGSAGFSAFSGAATRCGPWRSRAWRARSDPRGFTSHTSSSTARSTRLHRRELFPSAMRKRYYGELSLDAIENYWNLHHQARSAWTHELDLRPWMEPW